jgi:hypothetical protein
MTVVWREFVIKVAIYKAFSSICPNKLAYRPDNPTVVTRSYQSID